MFLTIIEFHIKVPEFHRKIPVVHDAPSVVPTILSCDAFAKLEDDQMKIGISMDLKSIYC